MARTGMTALIEELRGLCEAGTAEYTIGTTAYWSDNALQDVLDKYRADRIHGIAIDNPVIGTGGTLLHYDYLLLAEFWEQTTGGTSIFYLQNGGGTVVGTSLWTADYRRGVITFGSDTAGSTIYATGRTYDLNAAAADVWRKKAAHYAPTAFDFSTDNHSISRQQVYSHCIEMARFFEGSSQGAIQSVPMVRYDVTGY